MKFAINQKIITPQRPCMQCGYVQRTHNFESIHDDVSETTILLQNEEQRMVFVTTDLTCTTQDLKDKILKKLVENEIDLENEMLIISATHNHSAPSINLEEAIATTYGMGDPEYVDFLAGIIAEGIAEIWNQTEDIDVAYESVQIDGLYSNRNDPDKLSDKTVHLIAFGKEEQIKGIICNMSCHNTILGPLNYQITGELYGNLRRKLEEHYRCPVFMMQGNAGDMGNRQYRTGQEFRDLDLMVEHLAAQIIRKQISWEKKKMNEIRTESIVYDAKFTIDSSVYYKRIADYEEKLQTEMDLTNRKVMLSGIEGFKAKIAMGDGEHNFPMPAQIIRMGDFIFVCVDGELGSYLGLSLKRTVKDKICILWGYTNSCNLGYIVDKEAFELECQETNVTKFPEGVGEEYISYIARHI
jgi:hypothetical protein